VLADLLPIGAYTPRTSAWRTAVSMALLWGVPMTGLLMVSGTGMPRGEALAVGAVASVLFGTLWTYWFGRSMRRLIERLCAGEAGLVPEPAGSDYQVRVLANLMTRPSFAVGGHLYAGPTQLAFVPHTKNRAADRAPRVMAWEHISRVEAYTRPATGFARAFTAEPLPYLRVTGDGEEWLFRIPESARVQAALQPFLNPSTGAV
jgi:hypothetical protein